MCEKLLAELQTLIQRLNNVISTLIHCKKSVSSKVKYLATVKTVEPTDSFYSDIKSSLLSTSFRKSFFFLFFFSFIFVLFYLFFFLFFIYLFIYFFFLFLFFFCFAWRFTQKNSVSKFCHNFM